MVSWSPWCFQNAETKTVVLGKTLESPLENKEIKPDNPKENHPWIFTGRTDAETEALATWCEELTHWERLWRQEEKGMTENEMAGWHHRLNGHEFEQILGDGERQGSLACYSPWGCKELDMTKWLYNNICVCVCVYGGGLVTKLCLTPCDPIDCSLPGSSVHGDSPGKSTVVGCHFLPQGIFPTQGSNWSLLNCRQILYRLSYEGSP